MKLYHGTQRRLLDTILREGLKPRGKRKGQFAHSVPSRPDCVYLTACYAPYFCFTNDYKSGVVIEVDTDKLNHRNLAPDEDTLAHYTKEGGATVQERSAYYRDRLQDFRGASHWRWSLSSLGTCAHFGLIPPEAISRVAIIPRDYMWYWDASISPRNFNLLGGTYLKQTMRMFGDPIKEGGPKDIFGDKWKIPMDHKVYPVLRKGKLGALVRIKHPDERTSYLEMAGNIDNKENVK